MQIRNLGGSGLRVSAVGLGCNNFGQRTDLETSRKVIDARTSCWRQNSPSR
jgi:aryl-alcohol dehydrogenase-like predicted oxidoreductase